MDTNPKWTQSRMDTIPNGHNPEWTQSRMNTIPNGHHPEWAPSRMDTIPNEHLYIVTEVLYTYACLVRTFYKITILYCYCLLGFYFLLY